jgi:hypothetical protein
MFNPDVSESFVATNQFWPALRVGGGMRGMAGIAERNEAKREVIGQNEEKE